MPCICYSRGNYYRPREHCREHCREHSREHSREYSKKHSRKGIYLVHTKTLECVDVVEEDELIAYS